MLTKNNKGADFAYLFSEKIAYRLFVNIFYKLPFSANQVTAINFFINNLAAVILFALGRYWANLAAIFFIILSVIWDWMDGAVARKKGSIGGGGGFLDAGFDFIWQHLMVSAIIFSVVVKKGGDPVWLIIGLLAFVFLVLVNYFGAIYGENFGFGFRGDYDEFVKRVDSNKKAGLFDKFCVELLTYRKFLFIFLFTLRYPLLFGALFNRLDIFLIFLLATSSARSVSLFYLFFLYLESDRRKKNSLIVRALVERHQFWLQERDK